MTVRPHKDARDWKAVNSQSGNTTRPIVLIGKGLLLKMGIGQSVALPVAWHRGRTAFGGAGLAPAGLATVHIDCSEENLRAVGCGLWAVGCVLPTRRACVSRSPLL